MTTFTAFFGQSQNRILLTDKATHKRNEKQPKRWMFHLLYFTLEIDLKADTVGFWPCHMEPWDHRIEGEKFHPYGKITRRIHSNRRPRGQRFNRTIPEDGSLARNWSVQHKAKYYIAAITVPFSVKALSTFCWRFQSVTRKRKCCGRSLVCSVEGRTEYLYFTRRSLINI